MMNILGRKLDVRTHGAALLVKAWIDGVALYGEFTSIDAVTAWVNDFGAKLDGVERDVATAKLTKVFFLDEDTGEMHEMLEAA